MRTKKTIIVLIVVMMLLTTSCGTSAEVVSVNSGESMSTASPEEPAKEDISATEVLNENSASAEKLVLNDLKLLSGDFIRATEAEAPEEIDEEHAMELDRAMRAYKPSGKTLLVNNADRFYFYEGMTPNEQNIYDAVMMVVENPVDTNNIAVYTTNENINSDDFVEELYTAFWGALYDHPELFWLYNALETDIQIQAITDIKGKSMVYFSLTKPYENYEEEMNAFNEATEEFLEDIDLDQEDYEIAKDIHDKLISMVTYDYEVAEKNLMDLAHTAYGALVMNSRGDENTAVCDGYSLAYLYLLQQVGIPATVILGEGGSSVSDAGGHAWNVVWLGSDWYEVDSTWNDAGNTEEQLNDPGIDKEVVRLYKEALSDKEYREKLDHYMYNITTEDISDYKSSSEYDYYTKDGKYILNLVTDSVHIRMSELEDENYAKWLMDMAPEATGTLY